MKTRSLLKLSLVIAFLGTFILLFLSQSIEPTARAVSSINEKNLDAWIKIQGIVVDEQTFSTLKIITVSDETASINCVLQQNENISVNSKVEITGKIIEYKGQLEIEVSDLRVL